MKKIFLVIFFLTLFILFIFFSFHRFYIFQTFFYDFGIFARIIYKLSRFQMPYITHISLGYIPFLGDHFNPSLILLAPLFFFTKDVKILLIEQAFFTMLQGVMLYLIARRFKLSYGAALVISFVHLLFAGVSNPLLTDWHAEPTAAFFLLLFFYLFSFTKRKTLTYIIFIIFLGFKESNVLTFLSLMVVFFCIPLYKRKRKKIIVLSIIAVIWFFAATKILTPFFAKKPYLYTPDFPNTASAYITNFFNVPAKMKLMKDAFSSFGLLPLISGWWLVPIAGEFAIRFIPDKSFFQSYTLLMHYNVFLGVFLSLATISVIIMLKKRARKSPFKKKIELMIVVYLLITALFVGRKFTASPFNLATNRIFWREFGERKEFVRALQKVPRKGSIMSQNNLLSHFVARDEEVYLFSGKDEAYKPDIIVFDIGDTGNPNNFWPANEQKVKDVVSLLLADKKYKRIPTERKSFYIFVRNEKIRAK